MAETTTEPTARERIAKRLYLAAHPDEYAEREWPHPQHVNQEPWLKLADAYLDDIRDAGWVDPPELERRQEQAAEVNFRRGFECGELNGSQLAARAEAERDDFRNAALMYAATVDELRQHLDRANAHRDEQAQAISVYVGDVGRLSGEVERLRAEVAARLNEDDYDPAPIIIEYDRVVDQRDAYRAVFEAAREWAETVNSQFHDLEEIHPVSANLLHVVEVAAASFLPTPPTTGSTDE